MKRSCGRRASAKVSKLWGEASNIESFNIYAYLGQPINLYDERSLIPWYKLNPCNLNHQFSSRSRDWLGLL